MEYPIHGMFMSKRGTFWCYTIYSDGTIEQWHSNIVEKKRTGGYKTGKDTYVKPTKDYQYIIWFKTESVSLIRFAKT